MPGLLDDVPALDARERAALAALPFDEAALRADAGMLPGTRFTGEPDAQPLRAPLVSARRSRSSALEGMPLATAANQLIAEASARVGVRLAPGQDAERVRARAHAVPAPRIRPPASRS